MADTKVFTFYERLGLFLTIEASALSAIGCTLMLTYATVKWIKRFRNGWSRGRGTARVSDASDSSLFLNLMLSDLIQALGIFPSIKWVHESKITEGSVCTAQGVLKQLGINGVALTSLAIAFQTFIVLVLRRRLPQHAGKYASAFIWAFNALLVGVCYGINKDKGYYGNTGFWCWVNERFLTERIMSEYLWMWLSAAVMTILYGVMFLVMRGVISIGEEDEVAESDEDKKSKGIATLMLYYPLVYIVCVFPNSISRWLSFQHHYVPPAFTLFASGLFSLSGFLNLLLFFVTRPELVRGTSLAEEPVFPLPNSTWKSGTASAEPKQSTAYGHLPDLSADYSIQEYEPEHLGRLP
ncbi:hypothetical protein BDQ12DRAFT_672519, partial [Crucibulum laeve]